MSLSVRRWSAIHRWSSLACTAFLLLLCVTGLPLIFHDEIDAWVSPHHYAPVPDGVKPASLDTLAAAARHLYPRDVIASMQLDDDEPQVLVWMVPSFAAMKADFTVMHAIRFDARTGAFLEAMPSRASETGTFTGLMLALHTSLMQGAAGEWFLLGMGLVFLLALISGVVVYDPFMKRLRFGEVRHDKARRVRWLDRHNLLGISTLAWAFLVGLTGAMNELSTPLFQSWQQHDVMPFLATHVPPPGEGRVAIATFQDALESTKRVAPDAAILSIAFPGNPFGSPYHYLAWTQGNEPLTSHLLTPVLIDAHTGSVAAMLSMPWYLRTLEIARPVHFGDYGGIAMKVLWAVLDIVTIVVLVSGLYLWLAKGRRRAGREPGSAQEVST
ncbi:PepSY domain-containing protein [Luteibacter aegosomaticola]|uniref:PepSY-associated TM helix domain-containing protein n=1 Tax=Luteibacter aegosomaticola TaxID=2911538 RepID=UPI001FF73F0C|nr:PepSY-associated TM helix domain-containing protein [Luteibacter aegosomaticola]UPG89633.1 PepSY domain-containing protein [Luteibacter aegosomaticola]